MNFDKRGGIWVKYKQGDKFVDNETGYLYKIINVSDYREPSLAYLADVYDGNKYLGERFMSDDIVDKLTEFVEVQNDWI